MKDLCEHAIPNMDPSWSCELVAAGDEGAHEMAMRWPLRWWAPDQSERHKDRSCDPRDRIRECFRQPMARVAIMAMSRSTEADTALRCSCTLQDEPAVNFSSYQLLIHPGLPYRPTKTQFAPPSHLAYATFAAAPHCLKKTFSPPSWLAKRD